MSCYYSRVQNTCSLYTHVTPICNALVCVIYSVVSGQYSYTIEMFTLSNVHVHVNHPDCNTVTYLLTARNAIVMQGSNKGPPFLSVFGHLFYCSPGVIHRLQLRFYCTSPCVFGLPRLGFPSGVQYNAVLVFLILISSNHTSNPFPTPSI